MILVFGYNALGVVRMVNINNFRNVIMYQPYIKTLGHNKTVRYTHGTTEICE